jgi:hypothetical protein
MDGESSKRGRNTWCEEEDHEATQLGDNADRFPECIKKKIRRPLSIYICLICCSGTRCDVRVWPWGKKGAGQLGSERPPRAIRRAYTTKKGVYNEGVYNEYCDDILFSVLGVSAQVGGG